MAAKNEGETWIERTAARKGSSVGRWERQESTVARFDSPGTRWSLWHRGARALARPLHSRTVVRLASFEATLRVVYSRYLARCYRGPSCCPCRCVASARVFLVSRVIVPLLENIPSVRRSRIARTYSSVHNGAMHGSLQRDDV